VSYVTPQTLMIAATDSSFIPESGNDTYGPGRFYNGSRSQTGKFPVARSAVIFHSRSASNTATPSMNSGSIIILLRLIITGWRT
jgi:hypothetical protein